MMRSSIMASILLVSNVRSSRHVDMTSVNFSEDVKPFFRTLQGSSTIDSETNFELYASGATGICPEDRAVTELECLEAAHKVGIAGMTLKDSLNVGSWDFTPCGCFIYINSWVDYKDPLHGKCLPDSKSNLVCKKEVGTTPDSPAPETDLELYDNGAAGICPEGRAVTEQECLEAAHEVGIGMTLKATLNIGSWDFTPCGCFIYIDHWVDYKDPLHGKCLPDTNSNLVCRKELLMSKFPTVAPTYNPTSDEVLAYLRVPGINIGTTYSSAREELVINVASTDLDIPIYNGTNSWTSPEVNIGTLKYSQNPIVKAAIRFTYTYDPSKNMITLTGNDFVDKETSICLITHPEGSNQYCNHFPFLPSDIRNSFCNNNEDWDYTTSLTPGLPEKITENIRDINDLVYQRAADTFRVVRVRTPFPAHFAQAEDYHLNWIFMYSKDNEFLGVYDPEKEYPSGTIQRHPIQSQWGGEVTFKFGENFANVIGSTGDKRVGGLPWIRLWTQQFNVSNPTCTSLHWASGIPNSFNCSNPPLLPNIIGGHIILGHVAQQVPHGSNSVFIMPICKAHNANDHVYMAANVYQKGIWLKNYHNP